MYFTSPAQVNTSPYQPSSGEHVPLAAQLRLNTSPFPAQLVLNKSHLPAQLVLNKSHLPAQFRLNTFPIPARLRLNTFHYQPDSGEIRSPYQPTSGELLVAKLPSSQAHATISPFPAQLKFCSTYGTGLYGFSHLLVPECIQCWSSCRCLIVPRLSKGYRLRKGDPTPHGLIIAKREPVKWYTVKNAVELLDVPSKNNSLMMKKYNTQVELLFLYTHVLFLNSVIE